MDKLKIVRDPSVKGGARIYDKKKSREKVERSKIRVKDPNDNFGKGPKTTPCYSNPKCPKSHTSKEEAEFCYQLSKVVENQPDNWHVQINTVKIDYFMFQQVAIEYHNWYRIFAQIKEPQIIKNEKLIKDKIRQEKIREYILKRREILDRNKYQDYPLIVVTRLDGKDQPKSISDKSFIVSSIDDLVSLLIQLDILE